MKSRLKLITILLCALVLFAPAGPRTEAATRTARSTAARRQQALVKQINQRAVRFYRVFIRQSVRTSGVDCDLNELLEDLLLALDGLTDAHYIRQNLGIVIQIASDVEQELLVTDVSADIVMAWSRLHADLDQLAKMNGLKWSETIANDQFIAALR